MSEISIVWTGLSLCEEECARHIVVREDASPIISIAPLRRSHDVFESGVVLMEACQDLGFDKNFCFDILCFFFIISRCGENI